MKNEERNKEGYLLHWEDWNEAMGEEIAKEENLFLTEEHWMVIRELRDFYSKYQHTPVMRIFIKHMRTVFPEEKANSVYMYTLFPNGPIKQGCKIAGLPKPPHCI